MTALEHTKKYKTSQEFNTLLFFTGPFSQWWHSPFEIDGRTYNCTEQWMMAEKARIFDDEDTLNDIMLATGQYTSQYAFVKYPREQKRLGRKVTNFDPVIWDSVATHIVLRGNLAKFSQNTELLAALAFTNTFVLAEASPYDKIWGIKMVDTNPKAFNPVEWQGKNQLGKVLMLTRQYLCT